jgi:transcriptional regulator with XRE-family HTH domain
MENGQISLSDYISKLGISMADFAGQLGVTREAVRGWCAGDYLPSLLHVYEIEKATDGAVCASSFYSEIEMKRAVNNG